LKVCLGGTFNRLHKGHMSLLTRAFKVGDEVFIGITNDEMASASRTKLLPFEERKAGIEAYVSKFNKPYTIKAIDDLYGQAAELDLDAIIVSKPKISEAELINERRENAGLKPLDIIVMPLILADDGLPLSATRVVEKQVDTRGHLLRAVRVNVGSKNPVKMEAVRSIFQEVYNEVDVKAYEVSHGGPAQPKDGEVLNGAVERARLAIVQRKADFGIGIEAGLIHNKEMDTTFDVQYCAIIDRTGRITLGHGPGFVYPPMVLRGVEDGNEVGKVMDLNFGDQGWNKKDGAVGFLSKGYMDRTGLTEEAVIAALIPRISQDLYEL